MGCRIMVGRADTDDSAVFYCSTTGIAFGPVMTDREEAEAFMKWLDADVAMRGITVPHPRGFQRVSTDPRSYPVPHLMSLYTEFRNEYDTRTTEVEAELDAALHRAFDQRD